MKLIRKIIFFVFLIAILLVSKNFIAKFAIQKGFKAATGLELKISNFNLGITDTEIGIKNLRLLNPVGFSDKIMFEAPEIYVDYNLGAIFKGKVHLEEIRLDFEKLVVIKNAQGELNLNALKPKQGDPQEKKEATTEQTDSKKKSKAPDIQIDHVLLKIGKIIYKDYTQKGDPVIKEFSVNIYEKFDNISSAEELFSVIVQKALAKTALANLANFDIDFLNDSAIESLKEKVGSFTDKIKLPFGQN